MATIAPRSSGAAPGKCNDRVLGRDHSQTQRYGTHYARLLVETGRVGAGGASDVLNTIEVKSWDKLS
jgi:hypothetical protein